MVPPLFVIKWFFPGDYLHVEEILRPKLRDTKLLCQGEEIKVHHKMLFNLMGYFNDRFMEPEFLYRSTHDIDFIELDMLKLVVRLVEKGEIDLHQNEYVRFAEAVCKLRPLPSYILSNELFEKRISPIGTVVIYLPRCGYVKHFSKLVPGTGETEIICGKETTYIHYIVASLYCGVLKRKIEDARLEGKPVVVDDITKAEYLSIRDLIYGCKIHLNISDDNSSKLVDYFKLLQRYEVFYVGIAPDVRVLPPLNQEQLQEIANGEAISAKMVIRREEEEERRKMRSSLRSDIHPKTLKKARMWHEVLQHIRSLPPVTPHHIRPLPAFTPHHIRPLPLFSPHHIQTLPLFCPHHIGQLPSFIPHHIRPLPLFCPHHIQTLPLFCPHHIGQLPSFTPQHIRSLPPFTPQQAVTPQQESSLSIFPPSVPGCSSTELALPTPLPQNSTGVCYGRSTLSSTSSRALLPMLPVPVVQSGRNSNFYSFSSSSPHSSFTENAASNRRTMSASLSTSSTQARTPSQLLHASNSSRNWVPRVATSDIGTSNITAENSPRTVNRFPEVPKTFTKNPCIEGLKLDSGNLYPRFIPICMHSHSSSETETAPSIPLSSETETAPSTPVSSETETAPSTPVPSETETAPSTPVSSETETAPSTPVPSETETAPSTPVSSETETAPSTPLSSETETAPSTPSSPETKLAPSESPPSDIN